MINVTDLSFNLTSIPNPKQIKPVICRELSSESGKSVKTESPEGEKSLDH